MHKPSPKFTAQAPQQLVLIDPVMMLPEMLAAIAQLPGGGGSSPC
jgi:hypothetical protein